MHLIGGDSVIYQAITLIVVLGGLLALDIVLLSQGAAPA